MDKTLLRDVEEHWKPQRKTEQHQDEIFERLRIIQARLRSGADIIENIIKRELLYQSYENLYNSLKEEKDLKK